MNEQYLTPESSVLDDLDALSIPKPVTRWLRLANLILDGIVLWSVNKGFILLLAQLGITLTRVLPQVHTANDLDAAFFQVFWFNISIAMLESLVMNMTYYTLTEGLLQGRSVGKLVTGTQAVNTTDYQPVTLMQALLRSLCRWIPLEFLFVLFMQPWHDTLTHTTVIKKKQ